MLAQKHRALSWKRMWEEDVERDCAFDAVYSHPFVSIYITAKRIALQVELNHGVRQPQ